MKNLLVTGGYGFIGFNFLQYVKREYPDVKLYCIDSLTYAGQAWAALKSEWCLANDVKIGVFSICEKTSVEEWITAYHIDTIVNFAAESHVDNSISGPEIFFESNVKGVLTLLELVRKYDLRFHQIGTDEVYGSVDPEKDNVTENFPIHTSSPYSASKASADFLTLSYFTTYGCKVTVSRCSNNFGPWQHPEKLIPKTIINALNGENIPIYGDGRQRRFWIHVDDHNKAIMRILEYGKFGEVYNIAPAKENLRRNIDIVNFIVDHVAKFYGSGSLIKFVNDRPGHDLCYYLNGEKLRMNCFYSPKARDIFIGDLIDTITWYKYHPLNKEAK